MNYDHIDVAESIEKERIVFKKWSFTFVWNVIECIYGVAFLLFISGAIVSIQLERYKEYLIYGIFVFIVSLTVAVIFVRSNIKGDGLIKIKGISIEKNRQFINEIANELSLKIVKDNKIMTVLVEPWRWIYDGKQLIIIYDRQDILIKCTANIIADQEFKQQLQGKHGKQKFENKFREQFENKIKGIA